MAAFFVAISKQFFSLAFVPPSIELERQSPPKTQETSLHYEVRGTIFIPGRDIWKAATGQS